MKSNITLVLTVLLLVSKITTAQDLLDQLFFEEKKKTVLTESTFKTLRIGFSHSVETRKKGVLELSAYTRYWNIPEIDGVATETNNFGSDRVSARFGADYALNNNLTLGAGWANNGVYDGYLKYRLVRQKTGAKNTPFSITLLGAVAHRSEELGNVSLASSPDPTDIYNPSIPKASTNIDGSFAEKTNLTAQILIASKLDRNFSVQISPTVINRGSNRFEDDPDLHLAIGFGGRYKLGKHVSIASEYFYVPKQYALNSFETFGPFSLGVNWEVSKVQIQMFLTHTGDFTEDLYITETPVNFNTKDGNLFFGWNFSYVFHLNKKK